MTQRETTSKKNISLKHGVTPLHATHWKRTRHTLRFIVVTLLVILLTTLPVIAYAMYHRIDNVIQHNSFKAIDTQEEVIDPNSNKPVNILILGQDTREGANAKIGGEEGADNHQSDTAMIVNIAPDRQFINLVSIPRDTLVDQPACKMSNGAMLPARYNVMFNSVFALAYATGGDVASAASCSLKTVNAITDMNITQTIVVDFAGLQSIINAIGGVTMCIPTKIDDAYTGLKLEPGIQHLNGTQATQFARARHGVEGSDGSDLMRTGHQQLLIRALFKEILGNGTLSSPTKLYTLAMAGIQTLQISSGLANTNTLIGLAYSLRGLHANTIYSMTAPVTAAPSDPNRLIFTPEAEKIWEKLRENKPLTLQETPVINGSTHASDEESAQMQSQDNDTQNDDANAEHKSAASHKKNHSDMVTITVHGTQVTGKIDQTTGLLKAENGEWYDPHTGGILDKATGYIRDAETNAPLGIAENYVTHVMCKAQ